MDALGSSVRTMFNVLSDPRSAEIVRCASGLPSSMEGTTVHEGSDRMVHSGRKCSGGPAASSKTTCQAQALKKEP